MSRSLEGGYAKCRGGLIYSDCSQGPDCARKYRAGWRSWPDKRQNRLQCVSEWLERAGPEGRLGRIDDSSARDVLPVCTAEREHGVLKW